MTHRLATALTITSAVITTTLAANMMLTWPHALTITGTTALITWVLTIIPTADPIPTTPRRTHNRPGARDDVSHLSWTLFSRDGTTSYSGHTRLRAITSSALTRAGCDLTTASGQQRAQELLGPPLYQQLMTRTSGMNNKAVTTLLSRLDDITTTAKHTKDHS